MGGHFGCVSCQVHLNAHLGGRGLRMICIGQNRGEIPKNVYKLETRSRERLISPRGVFDPIGPGNPLAEPSPRQSINPCTPPWYRNMPSCTMLPGCAQSRIEIQCFPSCTYCLVARGLVTTFGGYPIIGNHLGWLSHS